MYRTKNEKQEGNRNFMSNISDWMRFKSQSVADELVEINARQFLPENISGFGMKGRVVELLGELKAALFPSLYEREMENADYLSSQVLDRLNTATRLLNGIIKDVLMNKCQLEKKGSCHGAECAQRADTMTVEFMESLGEIRRMLTQDIKAAYEGDPAAIYTEEILLSYPSVEAVSVYRMAHQLFVMGLPLVPRIMTEYAHQLTGIDIHPGAQIGEHFFIDHGTGVVIGETCVIGKNVKLYQGVTLGAKSFELDENGNPIKGVKRHPNIEDNVVIYAGATILGGDVTVGHDSVIGGNVWLLSSVPPYTKVYNATPKPIINTMAGDGEQE